MTSSSVVASSVTSRVFTSREKISRSLTPASARRRVAFDPSRSLVTAHVVSARPTSAATASDYSDADGLYSGEPILFRFGDDGEAVEVKTLAAETSLASFGEVASGRETWDHVDNAGLESAVEVLREPDGNLLFRFTGEARNNFEAAAAGAAAVPSGDRREGEATPTRKARAPLDEAAALIERAKAIQNGDATDTAAAAAKAARETLSDPELEGTVIMRRSPERRSGGFDSKTDPRNAGVARATRLGLKSIVDGIESVFSNFRKTPIAQSVARVTDPVRLPQAPKDSPWKRGKPNVSVADAMDTFGAETVDSEAEETPDAGFLFITEASDPEAAIAETIEEEHAKWESEAQMALERGSVAALQSEPSIDASTQSELVSERYGNAGAVVAGAWRPKPLEVSIAGRNFVAYITPSNLKQLPSGEFVVGDEEALENEGFPGDRVGEQTTIILAEARADGTNVFMFGLTRTVLRDGSILYRFPSGETLG